jgi:hypothetical protein
MWAGLRRTSASGAGIGSAFFLAVVIAKPPVQMISVWYQFAYACALLMFCILIDLSVGQHLQVLSLACTPFTLILLRFDGSDHLHNVS